MLEFSKINSHDYHIQESSPCIDIGKDINSPLIDFDSIPRLLLGHVDLGAFEYGIFWDGKISNDWFTIGNLSNIQVPISPDKVTISIPDQYYFYPKINANVHINALCINEGAKLEVQNNQVLKI